MTDFSPSDSSYASQITQVVKDDLNYSLYFRVAKIDTFVLTILGNDLYNMDGWYQLGVQYLLDGSIKMDQGKLKEKVLLKTDLKNADEIFLINSVRPWRKAIYME